VRRVKGKSPVFNHFRHINGVSTKNGLLRSLDKYYSNNIAAKIKKYGIYKTTPLSFIVRTGKNLTENISYQHYMMVQNNKNAMKDLLPRK